MKKIVLQIITFIITAAVCAVPLAAQENEATTNEVTPANEEQKPEVEKKEEAAGQEKPGPEKKARGVYTIGEVVVKGRAIANVEEASTTTELTSESIKARSQKTLDEALETVPGMIVKQGQKGQMNFDMRGFRHNTVALLVDGLPFEEVYDGGGGDISRILVMNASRIIVNRGTSSALYGSRGAFGAINVVTRKPDRLFFDGSTEFDHNGGFTVNASGGANIKNFYFWLNAAIIKNNSYRVSKSLNKKERLTWLNRLLPWYIYLAGDPTYTPGNTIFTPIALEYVLDGDRWNHTSSMKYYASGKAGYAVNDNIEFGLSASYYQAKMDFNGFEISPCSTYNLDGTWEDPRNTSMIQNRAWVWPKDYRFNVAPYLTLEFGDLYIKSIYYYTEQANILEGWTNQAHSAMFDRGKMSEHDETSHGFYVYPSYKITSWNKLNAVAHYRFDMFEKYKKRIGAFAVSGQPRFYTPWFKTAEITAKYITAALEDEMKFNTVAGDIRCSVGLSYDAQMLSRNRGGRYDINGNEDVLGLLRNRQKPNETSSIWGTGDSFNPVLAVVYKPLKEMLTIRATFSQKTKFPNLHEYSDTADYIDEYFASDPALLPLVLKLNQIKPETSYNANTGIEFSFFEKKLGLRGDYFYAFYKNRIESVGDPNAAVGNQTRYMNIRGREVHGVESTISSALEKDLLKYLDIDLSLTHVFTSAKDWYDEPVVKGAKVAETPSHQLIMKIAFNFISGTSLNIWSNSLFNQIIYVQQVPTALLATPSLFFTKVYSTKKLHDPFKLNIKVSQRIVDHFDVWVMCKNLLDDYNADPFNPGPGMTWYFGGSAEF